MFKCLAQSSLILEAYRRQHTLVRQRKCSAQKRLLHHRIHSEAIQALYPVTREPLMRFVSLRLAWPEMDYGLGYINSIDVLESGVCDDKETKGKCNVECLQT